MAPWFLGVAWVEEYTLPALAPCETSNTNRSDSVDYAYPFLGPSPAPEHFFCLAVIPRRDPFGETKMSNFIHFLSHLPRQ